MLTVFTVIKSDKVTFTVSSKSSALWFKSNWSCSCETVFVNASPSVPWPTSARNVKTSVTPGLITETNQSGSVQVPTDVFPETWVKPEGKLSVNIRFVTSIIPALVTVIV